MTALTITSVPIINSATRRQVYITVLAPASPTQATNTIIYDPTTTPYTTAGAYIGTKVRGAKVTSSCQGASGTQAAVSLNWDATTPVTALSVPVNGQITLSPFEEDFAVLPNQGGTGVTGKIGLTTLGLIAGDTITILLDIING